MRSKLALTLAVAAGFAGGALSQYISPLRVQAQTSAPRELRAQNFVLVNDKGVAYGLFGFDPTGRPILKLIDDRGRPVWIAPPPPLVQQPSPRIEINPRPNAPAR